MAGQQVPEGVLYGLGNPLLDLSTTANEEFLQKYNLKANDAILAEKAHVPMYDDMVAKFKVEFVPGGATQNSIRVAQWLLKTPNRTTYAGCIGKDKFGQILEEKSREQGVNVDYQYTDKEPTGTCAVLLTGNNRSLCAYLAAANCFTKDHLDTPKQVALIEKAKFYYIGGFPLTVSPPSMLHVAQHACRNNKMFCTNLSAPFLCQFFKEPMMQLMPYVDILFGNETEAETFNKEQSLGAVDIQGIALKVAALPKENKSRSRVVVFTQGAEKTVVVTDGKVTDYPVVAVKQSDIVDTNGAGDAFVGGFLSQLVQGKSLDDCVRCGHYAANVIIQRSGCSLPASPSFE